MTIAEMEARLLALPELIANAEVEYKMAKYEADGKELHILSNVITTGKDAEARKIEREIAVHNNADMINRSGTAYAAEAKYHALVREYDAITTILRRGA